MNAIFPQVCIAGLSHTGYSLALAIKQTAPDTHITSWDPSIELADQALAQGAIDQVAAFPQDAVAKADLLILAGSPDENLRTARVYGKFLPPTAILTDTHLCKHSTQALSEHAPPGSYVGSAPLLPPAQRRAQPSASRFTDHLCILHGTDPTKINKLTQLWETLGAQTKTVAPRRHDLLVAALYHAPLVSKMVQQVALHELSEGLPELPTSRLDPDWQLLLEENKSATMAVLGRQSSITRDWLGWLELHKMDAFTDALKDIHE